MIFRANSDASSAVDTFHCRIKNFILFCNRFGIVAPTAMQRAALEIYNRSNPGAVMKGDS